MEYIGYGFALLIGLILGLTGGGGSILTVPVLVYVMQFNTVTATAYSLFIVGTTSAVGTIQHYRNGLIAIRTGLMYALPSLAGVFLARRFLIAAIPPTIFQTAHLTLTKDTLLMLSFAMLILIVSISMLTAKSVANVEPKKSHPAIVTLKLFGAGVLVGMVGAGGGFLFTPLLLYVARLPMKKAVATSLMIIAINSLLGFTGDIGNLDIDWTFLLIFAAFSTAGIFAGIYLNRFVNEQQLKRGFGWFVLVMAVFILLEELVF